MCRSRSLLVLLLLSSAALLPLRAANGLESASSTFLRDHRGDPVDWQPWGDAALARAKKENKPIYVCVGAFTSELSRAMHKQSFTNPQLAESLNHDFICILVDRDERPDLAALFQSYVQSNKQLNGWPTNVWLTPDLKPFEGATYLPPSEEWGKEGVLNVIKRVAAAWHASPESVQQKAAEGVSTAIAAEAGDQGPTFSVEAVRAALTKATETWLRNYDEATKGFGYAPRFAEPELLRFLLRTPGPGREAAVATLHAIDRGALHDPLDGGFFHKAVDGAWQFPSFQKLLGDQARLALAFLDAAQVTNDPSFSAAARSAIDYGLNRLAVPHSGCIHAEDATPEELAASFGWTRAEIVTVLGEKEATAFSAAFGVTPEGNVSSENDPGAKWKDKNILFRVAPAGDAEAEARLSSDLAKLHSVRFKRARPLRDETVLIGENGLWLTALAQAGLQLNEARYLEAAGRLADFLSTQGIDPKTKRLLRVAGNTAEASADDYAYVALGIQTLNAGPKDKKSTELSARLLHDQETSFLDPKSSRYFAQPKDAPTLWLRPHLLDPAAGEAPSAETATLLAYHSLGTKADKISAPLLRNLMAALNEASGQPRGDVLLAASLLVDGVK